MLRRHPVLIAVAVMYGVALCIVSFGQVGVFVEGAAVCFLIFLPLGALLVLLLGQFRWRLALALGIVVCTWIELGRVVWHPERGFDGMMLLTNVAGTLVGGMAVALALRATEHPSVRHDESLSPLSQGPLQGLGTEIPPD